MTAVRTLLAVVVATALLGASLPAIEDARVDRTTASVDATADRLTEVASALVATDDPVPRGDRGASRTVVLTLPSRGFVDAGTDYLSIGGVPNDPHPTTLGYRVADGSPRRLDTGVRFVTGTEPLVLGPGGHTLRLTLVRTADGVGVRVRVVGQDAPAGTTHPQSDDG